MFCFLGHTVTGQKKRLTGPSHSLTNQPPASTMKSAFMLELTEHISLARNSDTGKCIGGTGGFRGALAYRHDRTQSSLPLAIFCLLLLSFFLFAFCCCNTTKASITASVCRSTCLPCPVPPATTCLYFFASCLSIICVILIQKINK